tara:strand:- start:400 stop:885 length:486 start_codon:yes stop_codon:yes gene_type:complete
MKIKTLTIIVLLAVAFSCAEEKQANQNILPSFSGIRGFGKFIIVSEAGSDTGMKLTPGVGGEKIYVNFVKARILKPSEFDQVVFMIREVKAEDENWHPIFQSDVGTIYAFSDMEQRLQSSHGGPTFEIEDFTNLEEMIQPVDPANASNAASVNLNQSARIR